jgi:nicotinate-nucleotide pyrophosphorylase (carboxylating)
VTLPYGAAPTLAAVVGAALAEDVGRGDVTTDALVPPGREGRARIVARSAGVLAGVAAAAETYRQVDGRVRFMPRAEDGAGLEPEMEVARAEGPFAGLLVAERTVLNFLQRLSGVATLTARFVAAVAGTGATIVDTRKTTPGLRALEKAAVRAGGGTNHRSGLDGAFLIKENHVVAAGGIGAALDAAGNTLADRPIEIEVRSIAELDEVLAHRRPDRILLDNFPVDELARAVARARREDRGILLEASGGVTLGNVAAIAATGVDWISVGALTHSAPALDLSCLIDLA